MVKEDSWLAKWIKKLGFKDDGELEVKYVEPPIEFFAEALEHNQDKKHRNRKLKPTQIKELTTALEEGEWGPNNDVISFTTAGRLINGQNRSTMFVQTSKTARVLIGINYPPSAFKNMDGAIRRTIADAFHADNLDFDSDLGVAVRLLWLRLNGKDVRGSKQLRQAQAFKVLADHPGLQDSVKFLVELNDTEGQEGHVKYLYSIGYFAALHYLMSNSGVEKPKTTANEFFKQLADFDDLDKGSGAVRLRVCLTKDKTNPNGRMERDTLIATVINAWLAYVSGDKESKVKAQKGERPVIGNLDITPEEVEEEVPFEEPTTKPAKAGECPKGGKHKWVNEEGEKFCSECKEPRPVGKKKKAAKKRRRKTVATV